MSLIDKEETLDFFNQKYIPKEISDMGKQYINSLVQFQHARFGKWIYTDTGRLCKRFICSECKEILPYVDTTINMYKYCPFCGIKIEGIEE